MADEQDSFEFYVYDDGSWRALIDERWHDTRDRLAEWVLTDQLDVLDVESDEPLSLDAVRHLDDDHVRRSLVRFRARGALARQMRSTPELQYEIDPESPTWAVTFTEAIRGYLPRLDAPNLQPPCSPAEMPDVRLSLVDAWQRPAWRNAARAGIARARALGTAWLDTTDSLSKAVDAYCNYEQHTLREAEMWWVGEEMCDLLYATASKVPDETSLEHLTLPSTKALVVFAKPWLAIDADSGKRSCAVDAITWGPAKLRDDGGDRLALGVSAYRLLDFGAGLSPSELTLATATDSFSLGRKQLVSKTGEGALMRSEFNVTGRVWVTLGRSDWPVKASVGDADTGHAPLLPSLQMNMEKQKAYVESAVEDRKLVAALSLLLNTRTMTKLDDARLPRPVRRRSQRAGVPSTVNVVYMRRPEHAHTNEPEHDDKPAVEWSHRWIVSAHVRLQPYGPGRSMRKLIMVPPHVKGPDDKPLVVKPTVKAWIR